MPGVRIAPTDATLAAVGLERATLAGRDWIVRDVSRPTRHPVPCAVCGHHDVKTYHLTLDADGCVIVSQTIWDRLRTLYDDGGFAPVNDVKSPPTQTLVLPSASIAVAPAQF